MAGSDRFDWRLRPLSDSDFDGVVALSEARADALKSPTRTARDGWRRWWAEQAPSLAEDNLAAVDGADRIVGLASLRPATDPCVTVFASPSVHPEYWDRAELWDALGAGTLCCGPDSSERGSSTG